MKIYTPLLATALFTLALPVWGIPEHSAAEHFARIDVHEFKDLLEDDRIVTVETHGWNAVQGTFINTRGETQRYRISYLAGPGPFLVEAVRSKGLEVDHAPSADTDYEIYSSWKNPALLILYALLGVFAVMNTITFVMVVRILDRVKSPNPAPPAPADDA